VAAECSARNQGERADACGGEASRDFVGGGEEGTLRAKRGLAADQYASLLAAADRGGSGAVRLTFVLCKYWTGGAALAKAIGRVRSGSSPWSLAALSLYTQAQTSRLAARSPEIARDLPRSPEIARDEHPRSARDQPEIITGFITGEITRRLRPCRSASRTTTVA